MSEKIITVGENLELWRAALSEIREQDVNANVMPPEMFERLAENIKKEGRLESVPFTVLRDGFFELISGHHRVRAARAAGLKDIIVLADTRPLSRSQVVAKQLAHNSIDGKDDPEILKQLFAEIDRVEDIIESYINPEDILGLDDKTPYDLDNVQVDFPWRVVTFSFLPNNLAKLEDLVAAVPKDSDLVGVAPFELFERFRNALIEIGRTENIKMVGAIVLRMCELVEAYLKKETKKKKKGD